MLSSIIVRYASRRSFSLPRINFQYAQQDSEVMREKICSPVLPLDIDKDNEIVYKKNSKYKQRLTSGTDKEFKKENQNKIHEPISKENTFNRKQNTMHNNKFSRKFQGSENFDKLYNEKQKASRLRLEGKYSKFSAIKSNPKGEFLFGIHPICHALQAQQRKIHCLYYKTGLETTNVKIQEILDLAKQHNLPVQAVDALQLKRYVGEDRVHQGICGDVSPLPFQNLDIEFLFQESKHKTDVVNDFKTEKQCEDEFIEGGQTSLKIKEEATYKKEINNKPYQLWLYMDRIQDPMNFGAILRSAYFMGVDRVLTSKENSCCLSGVVSKASAGAAELLPVYQVDDIKHLFNHLTNLGWNLVSTAAKGTVPSIPLNEYEPDGNMVLAVGNEGLGISSDLQDIFKTTITIHPGRNLQSGMDSLNVSVATAVILHSITAKLSSLNKQEDNR